MPFERALWDNSDPLYAPGLSWSNPKHPRWKAPKRYVDAGYKHTSARLEGHKGDGRDKERAAKCREYTRDMERWWQGEGQGPDHRTWAYLIARYKGDEFSPIRDVKANTREGYLDLISVWEQAIGHMTITSMTYETGRRIQQAMADKGRSRSNIKRHFVMLRTITSYGCVLPETREAAVMAREVLAGIKLRSAPQRDVAPNYAQIRAIIDEADARGMFAFATGLLMQWTYMVRAVDIRGHWLPADASEGGIWRHGRRWQDGLTWDMVEPSLDRFRKVISKTEKSMPEAMEFTTTPEIKARLQLLANGGRVGPVITASTGYPYTKDGWAQSFRRIRDHLGLPPEIKAMDLRAGGVTEAKNLGADPMALRDAAQHASVTTTDRYARNRSENINKVVELRGQK